MTIKIFRKALKKYSHGIKIFLLGMILQNNRIIIGITNQQNKNVFARSTRLNISPQKAEKTIRIIKKIVLGETLYEKKRFAKISAKGIINVKIPLNCVQKIIATTIAIRYALETFHIFSLHYGITGIVLYFAERTYLIPSMHPLRYILQDPLNR